MRNMAVNNRLVDVHVVTYNHEKYVVQALDSVLMQKTNFDFKILVGDDASDDGTVGILKLYKHRYPDRIELHLNQVNLGPASPDRIGVQLIKLQSQARYIALLDGDDYWTDPYKLQKQVDILEKNPDCVVCHHWHRVAVKDTNGVFVEKDAPKGDHGYNPKQINEVADIFKFQLRPQTRTLMFRNVFNDTPLPDWFYKVKFGDIALSMILGKYGKFYFIDEAMAVYRYSDCGISSMFNTKEGSIKGNKQWMLLMSYALQHHHYRYEKEALEGMRFFVDRIKRITKDSLFYRLKLAGFVYKDLDLRKEMRRNLLRYIMQ